MSSLSNKSRPIQDRGLRSLEEQMDGRHLGIGHPHQDTHWDCRSGVDLKQVLQKTDIQGNHSEKGQKPMGKPDTVAHQKQTPSPFCRHLEKPIDSEKSSKINRKFPKNQRLKAFQRNISSQKSYGVTPRRGYQKSNKKKMVGDEVQNHYTHNRRHNKTGLP
jgi:hypothetical protein